MLLAGCSADAEPGGSTDTGASTSTSGRATTGNAVTETSAPAFVLPETCSGLLTLEAIDAGLGFRITGTTQYVVGLPEPGIGRTGRVTCSYGVIPAADGTSGAPLVQASVFTYDSAESALDRVEAVVGQGRAAGNRSEDVPVGDYPAVVLVSVTEATLVVAVQDRNYAITLAPGLVSDDELAQAMASLAQSAINGGQPITTTTAPTATPTGTS